MKIKQFSNGAKAGLLLALSLALVSCETVGYYTQAARGQLAIVTSRQSIAQLLADEKLDSHLRMKLEFVSQLRQFARSELMLPVGDNYGSYVYVGREHVVWNVFAAPEFSVSAVNWCYPIAGCVAYRGYFSEAGALDFARATAAKGFDVYTGGVDAYSTLGWFDDSVLSTIITRSDYQLAGLIFHELAHQVVYRAGDTTFNESFASTVEREGLRRWLSLHGDPELLFRADQDRERQNEFVNLVTRAQEKFSELYESEVPAAKMRSEKSMLQEGLRDEYASLKATWDGYAGYDSWFSKSLNNAQLSTVSAYNDFVPFFNDELNAAAGDLEKFYQRVENLSKLDAVELALLVE
ncbi:MAG: putative aminopeptidase [Pseudohongiellaceae bacterium]|jgi:predicted aminopeptidase